MPGTNPLLSDPLWQGMAQAAATAKSTGKPASVDAGTNAYATLVANPDGTFTALQAITPQRAKINGQWQPIDTTLTTASDGSIHSTNTLATVTLSSGGTGPLAVVDDGGGHVLTITWPAGPLPKPTIAGATATYPDVYPGVDLQMVALPAGIQDFLVIHTADAGKNPALDTVNFGVNGSGLSISATSNGGVTAKDTKGHEVFGGPTPAMWDSNTGAAASVTTAKTPAAGTRLSTATLPATVSGATVSIHPDRKLLSAKSTIYPVTVDPIWTENAQNWMEIWSNGTDIINGQSPPPYDTSAVRVGNNGSVQIHSLLQFNAMPLPWPARPDAVGPYQQAIYISKADLHLTSQSATCPSTQVWRANWDSNATWSSQYGGTGTNLWPASGTSKTTYGGTGPNWTNPIATIGGSTSCQNQTFDIDDTQQIDDVYYNQGSSYTIGLRPTSETSTTNNYGSYFIQSNPNAASLSVNFVAEPFGIQTYASSNNTVTVGNHTGASGAVCNTNSNTPGYLPLTAGTVPVSAVIGDWDARPVNYTFYVNDQGAPPGSYNELQPNPALSDGTMSGGRGSINVPSYAGGQTGPGPNPANPATATIYGSVQAGGGNPNNLQDGHKYQLWSEITDGGTDDLATNLNNALSSAIVYTGTGSSYPQSSPCYFIAALSRPNPPHISSNAFPAPGAHITTGYPTVGTTGTINVTGTAPATPIDHFDWALNTTSTNEGNGNCGNPVPAGINCGTAPAVDGTPANGVIPASASFNISSGEHWGDNYLYVSAVDKAGNVSDYARYDFFLAQAWQPVSFGNVSGDGIPDLMGVDSGGNLVTYQANLDPTPGASSLIANSTTGATAPNIVQAAPASAGPNIVNGTPTWSGALYSHHGAERVQPTDDLFAWGHGTDGNGHLYYYFNGVHLSVPTPAGQNPNPQPNAFSQTQQALITRPTCSPSVLNGNCDGYAPDWNSVQQILALGPVNGGCNITAPTTACKTNLITVESYPPGSPSRMWLFSPAGTGQLRNPILLSVSQPGAWDWSKTHLMAPGNAAGHAGGAGGLPDLWAIDPAGTLWQFANRSNTGVMGAGLGDLTNKTRLGTTGQFRSYQSSALPGIDPSGNPDLWALTPTNQFIALTGDLNSASAAALSATVNTPTQESWSSTAGVSSLQGTPIPPSGLAGQLLLPAVTGGPSGQKCLDDLNGSLNNSTTVIDLYDCNGTWPQQWYFATDGTIRLMGANPIPGTLPGKCLDTGGSLLQNQKVTLFDCQANTFQQWRTIPSPSNPGQYWIYSPTAGMCLDDTGGSNNNTNPFQLYPCIDSIAQRFALPAGVGQTQSIEAENLGAGYGSNSGGTMTVQCCSATWSNGAQLWLNNSTNGSSMTLNYYVANSGLYQIVPTMTKATDYGKVTLTIDNSPTPLPLTFDGWQSSGVSTAPANFGAANLSAGTHSFTFKTTGTNASSTGNRYNIGVDVLTLTPTSTTGPTPGLTIPNSGLTGVPVTADASTTIPGTAAITGYTFDFGDGTVIGPQSAATATHTYTTTGTYQIKVSVTDANTTATNSSSISVTAGPTHWWKLNDGSGTTAADSGNPGTLPATLAIPGTSWPSATGYAAFAGTTGSATTTASAVDTTKSFTVAAWVNLNNLKGYQTFLTQKGNNVGGFHLEFENNGANGNVWTFARATSDTIGPNFVRLNSSAGLPKAGAWTHLIASWDADNATMYLYVNGQLVGTAIDTSPIASNGPLIIGRGFVNGNQNNPVDGGIADVRVYQQAFSSDLASWLYQNTGFTKPAVPAGMAGALISEVATSGNPSRQVCVDDIYGNLTNSTAVIGEYDCNHGFTQAWQFASDGTIRVMGQNPATPPNKCLDTGGVNTQGSKVTLFDCQAGNSNQVWKIVPSAANPGQYALQNPLTGLCLDDTSGITTNTNPFQLYACLDNTNQHFLLPTGSGDNQTAEAESVASSATGGTLQVQPNCCGVSWSNGAQLWFVNSAAGNTLTFNYYVANAGTYAIAPVMTKAGNYGIVQMSIDGVAALPNTFDGYNNGVTTQQYTFGTATLSAGMHSFTFKVTGTNPASNNGYEAGVDVLALLPTTG